MPWLPFRKGVFASGTRCLRDNDVMVSKGVVEAGVSRRDVDCVKVQQEANMEGKEEVGRGRRQQGSK